MSSALYRMGRYAARRPWTVIGVWMLVAAAIIGASQAYGRELEDTFEVPGLDSQLAVELLSQAQSEQAGLTARVVMTPLDDDTNFFDSPSSQDALAEVHAALVALPNVVAASDPAAMLTQRQATAVEAGVISPDGKVALIVVQYPILEELARADLTNLEAAVADQRTDSPLQIEMGGDLFFALDESETNTGEAIGLVAAVIILLLAFGSLIAMGLPVGMALFGLALGISSMSLVTYLIEIPSWAPQIGSMVGIGVGIDYALFLVTRHREFLSRGMTVEESVGRAVATAGQAVVFAGGTVVIAILGLAVANVPFITAAGVATSMIVLIMVIASITLLPAFLGIAGHWINRLGIYRHNHAGGNNTAGSNNPAGGNNTAGSYSTDQVSPGWARWGKHVSAHPWPYAIGVTAILLALTAPVLALRLGFPDDGTLPESTSQRRAFDLVADGFGPGINGPLLVAVDISSDATVVEPLAAAISIDPGVAGVASADVDREAGVATLVVFPTTAPQANETIVTVERLRSTVLPSVLADSAATAHVGGQTANVADVAGQVTARLPYFILTVIALSFVLLMLVFRSVLVPLKAALLNLLSIGAAYGLLVMVFQWGWGKELIGLETTVPIVSFIPMFMFAILFGLSMDYEVFLLSRVREDYLDTGDNDAAVISGLASTARVITSAALIMISVFGAFVLGSDPVTKMFGLGLAAAIFVDATIVRVILVPATMKLMGEANWWMPAWLDRILPTVDIEGETGLPEPEFETTATIDTRTLELDFLNETLRHEAGDRVG